VIEDKYLCILNCTAIDATLCTLDENSDFEDMFEFSDSIAEGLLYCSKKKVRYNVDGVEKRYAGCHTT